MDPRGQSHERKICQEFFPDHRKPNQNESTPVALGFLRGGEECHRAESPVAAMPPAEVGNSLRL